MKQVNKVGLVGLGLVGKALAKRFLAADYYVIGMDINPTACITARESGVEIVNTPEAIAQQCALIFLSLTNSTAVEAVLWGEHGVGNSCLPPTTIVDTTTTDPNETIRHHRKLATLGITFVDCPLIGSSQEIAEAKGVAIVGTTEEAAAHYLPLLRAFAKQVYFLGQPGNGHKAKLVVNLVLGLNRIALAEGLGLAHQGGIELPRILDILRSSAAYSEVMDTQGQVMLNGVFGTPVARLAQHAKDVGLILKLAAETGARVPASRLHDSLLKEAIEANWGELDNSAVINLYIPPKV